MSDVVGSVLVIGGGVGGMQSALDLADSGFKVYLLENSPSIGGKMAQLDKTFPTNDCSMCIMSPKLVSVGRHPNIELISYADLESAEGGVGNFKIKIKKKPRYVDGEKCTGCGTCMANCPVRYEPYIDGAEQKLHPSPDEELAPDVKTRVDEILDSYREQRNKVMPILQDINSTYKYLPEDVMRYVACELEMALSTLYQIATFYNSFRFEPPGEHIIKICEGTACHVKGIPKIVDAFQEKLDIKMGETTADGQFSMESARCFGCCGLAPVITVDEDVHGKLKSTDVAKILRLYKKAEKEES